MSITNVITRITVDMAGDVKRFAVKAKQYDRATRVIVVSLLWDEVPYVLDSADTVRCNVHKPDGTIAIIEGDNIAVNGNTVTITLPGTALTAAGRAWADIEIETQDESQQVSCQCFEIDIAKSPVDDDSIISTNEFSAMKLATKAANDAAAAATAEIEATAAAGTAASQAAAAAQAATDAANQAAAAATASIQIDPTLTDNSKAAPAGMVGEIKEDLSDLRAEVEGGGSGLTAELKAALDQLAQKIAYIDEDGQTYYDALHAALYPPVNLTRISCVYTQSGTVYDSDTLDSLRPDLVVTAHYNNGTAQTVTTYTLSGTLAEGTNTITVSYEGKTTTFSVVAQTEWGNDYTWLYKASDGQLLSARTDLVTASIGTGCTETLENGVLKLSVQKSDEGVIRFNLVQQTNTKGKLTAKVRINSLGITAAGTGVRLQISNGTSGAQIYENQSAGIYNFGVYEGSTYSEKLVFKLNTWHIISVERTNAGQVVSVDGTVILESSAMSTYYCSNNAIIAHTPNADLNADIAWVAYQNND